MFAAVTESYVVPVCISESRLADAMDSLQMVLMGRFCIFFIYKTVNCHMQARGASRVKYKLRVCPDGTNLSSGLNKLAEG